MLTLENTQEIPFAFGRALLYDIAIYVSSEHNQIWLVGCYTAAYICHGLQWLVGINSSQPFTTSPLSSSCTCCGQWTHSVFLHSDEDKPAIGWGDCVVLVTVSVCIISKQVRMHSLVVVEDSFDSYFLSV